ncbi:hypothetical protein TNIN_376741 [Trichonephila inaurata madagascariensis]|uniref:Uncharacterized protein n=1 Tax=Trichonephila inaurata madagascariensis TaxID=2747483 RepID=A0A8X6YKE8_9ARAC|nr:hypothetical protein TNIN_376741 [Trichonephila inaurata madagascariensis]
MRRSNPSKFNTRPDERKRNWVLEEAFPQCLPTAKGLPLGYFGFRGKRIDFRRQIPEGFSKNVFSKFLGVCYSA